MESSDQVSKTARLEISPEEFLESLKQALARGREVDLQVRTRLFREPTNLGHTRERRLVEFQAEILL